MKRLGGFLLVGALLLPSTASAACTGKHRCAKILTATSRLHHWRSPRAVPRDATLEIRVWAHGRRLRVAVTGLTAVFLGPHGAVLVARARRERAPFRVDYAAHKRMRLRVVYWTHD